MRRQNTLIFSASCVDVVWSYLANLGMAAFLGREMPYVDQCVHPLGTYGAANVWEGCLGGLCCTVYCAAALAYQGHKRVLQPWLMLPSHWVAAPAQGCQFVQVGGLLSSNGQLGVL